MTWFTGIVVYILIWWLVLFTVLPWMNRPAENPQLGHVTSAPNTPNLGRKFIITSAIAAFLWVCVFAMVTTGIINYRAMAQQMRQEDHVE